MNDAGTRSRSYIVLLLLLALLAQAADVVTTTIGLRYGASEANPLVKAILDNLGVYGLVAFKLLFALYVVALARVHMLLFLVINGFYFYISYQNLQVIENILASR